MKIQNHQITISSYLWLKFHSSIFIKLKIDFDIPVSSGIGHQFKQIIFFSLDCEKIFSSHWSK